MSKISYRYQQTQAPDASCRRSNDRGVAPRATASPENREQCGLRIAGCDADWVTVVAGQFTEKQAETAICFKPALAHPQSRQDVLQQNQADVSQPTVTSSRQTIPNQLDRLRATLG